MTNPAPANATIAPDYYLTNFQFLVNWVRDHYADLLSNHEQDFIERFFALDQQSQCLFVRLSSRKGPYFRADKLSYSEIISLDDTAQHLIAASLINTDSLLGVEDIANLLTKVELLNLFPNELGAHKNDRKDILLQKLSENNPETKRWECWTQNQLGSLYRLDTQPVIDTLLLLFFGNTYQDLTEFVLQDLGLYRYENYTIDHHHRIFKSRLELEQYQTLINLREQLAVAETLEHLIAIAQQLPNLAASNTIARRFAKLCNQLAYEFERHSQYDIALGLYAQNNLPPARERRIRLLEKQGNYTAAWQLLTELFSNPCNEQELQCAERMAPRLAKKCGESLGKKPPLLIPEQKLALARPTNAAGEFVNVEEAVRLHFQSPQAPCMYVENQLLSGLFGLWLWPEMFRSLDGAFANPFQSAPLDMYEESFLGNRPQVTALWKLFENNAHLEHIRTIWKSKYGIANHFVNWQALDENILDLALTCIPAQHLKLIFERILFDIKNNRSGLPDLIQFFPETCDYCMIEVKGPGDRIQDNQRRWLNFFLANGIPAQVVYVSWQ